MGPYTASTILESCKDTCRSSFQMFTGCNWRRTAELYSIILGLYPVVLNSLCSSANNGFGLHYGTVTWQFYLATWAHRCSGYSYWCLLLGMLHWPVSLFLFSPLLQNSFSASSPPADFLHSLKHSGHTKPLSSSSHVHLPCSLKTFSLSLNGVVTLYLLYPFTLVSLFSNSNPQHLQSSAIFQAIHSLSQYSFYVPQLLTWWLLPTHLQVAFALQK